MKQSLSILFIICCFLDSFICSYTSDIYACPIGSYYNTSNLRCEINITGVNLNPTTSLPFNCDYTQFSELYDGTTTPPLIICKSFKSYKFGTACKYYQAIAPTNVLVCTQCNPGFTMINGFCVLTKETAGCAISDSISSDPTICSSAAGGCQIGYQYNAGTKICERCLDGSPDQCTSISGQCNCGASCNPGYVRISAITNISFGGCFACPISGCKTCTATNTSGLVYTCSNCQDGYYPDVNSANVSICVSCERMFGFSCNTCNKKNCLTCKPTYYLNPNTNLCVSCPQGTVCTYCSTCTSGTSITSCTGLYSTLITVSGSTFCQQSDPNLTVISPPSCNYGYTYSTDLSLCLLIDQDQCSTASPCTTCSSLTALTLPIAGSTPASVECIECQGYQYGQPILQNNIFFYSTTSTPPMCFVGTANPTPDPNCFNEFGFAQDTGGQCNVCLPGYSMQSGKCTPCISVTVNSATSKATVSYGCLTPAISKIFSIGTFASGTSTDPNTQPQFYSAFLGVPQNLLKDLQINILNKDSVPTDDNNTPNTGSNNGGSNNVGTGNQTNTNNSQTDNGQNLSSDQNSTFKQLIAFQITLFLIILCSSF